jgi:Icc protein
MPLKNPGAILPAHNHDGIDRGGFLRCMAWAGTGALCVLEGGVLKSYGLDDLAHIAKAARAAN